MEALGHGAITSTNNLGLNLAWCFICSCTEVEERLFLPTPNDTSDLGLNQPAILIIPANYDKMNSGLSMNFFRSRMIQLIIMVSKVC